MNLCMSYCCVAATIYYLLINTHLGFAGLQAAGLTDCEPGESIADEYGSNLLSMSTGNLTSGSLSLTLAR